MVAIIKFWFQIRFAFKNYFMKTLNIYFKTSTVFAFIAWSLLIFFPNSHFTNEVVILIIVSLLSILYGYLLIFQKNHDDTIYPKGSFSSLDGVVDLFKNPKGVLIGWIHYLAFDLMVGLYIQKEATSIGMSHWLQIPCFLLTFIFGPLGFLLFIILKLVLF